MVKQKNGLLHRDDLPSYQVANNKNGTISQYIRQGEKLLVQVNRDETGTKGAKLTGLIELSSDSFVYIHGIDYVGVSKKFQNWKMQNHWRSWPLNIKSRKKDYSFEQRWKNQSEAFFLQILQYIA